MSLYKYIIFGYMKKRLAIGKVKACKLFRKYQDMNVPGANLLMYSHKIDLEGQIDTACIVCNLDDLKNLQISDLVNKTRGICLKIQQKCLQSSQQFQLFFTNTIAPLVNQQLQNKQKFKALFLEWKQNTNEQTFVTIIKYLQLKEICLIIKPEINVNNWTDYQQKLAIFSNKVLQQDYLVLSSISIVLSLPPIECQNYSKYLLSIWRRTLPTQIGRLVLEDQGEKSRQLELLFIKNMQCCWLIQFITQNGQRLQKLSQQALGLI